VGRTPLRQRTDLTKHLIIREISAHADACIPASERAGDVSERPELEAVDE